MISRRGLLASVSSTALIGSAGCVGTGSLSGNQIEEVTAEGRGATLTIKDGSKVESVNLINEVGEHVASSRVQTGASSISFPFVWLDRTYGRYRSRKTGEYEFVAVNEDDDEVGSASFTHEPRLEFEDISTGAVEFPDIEESGHWIVLSVTNTGTGPAVFTGTHTDHVSGEAQLRESDDKSFRFIPQDSTASTGHLDMVGAREQEAEDNHYVSPGETKKFVNGHTFLAETGLSASAEACSFEQQFEITPYSIPEPETHITYEGTVRFSGKLGVEEGFISNEYWCEETEVTSFGEIESA